jgi:hypothetical protein
MKYLLVPGKDIWAKYGKDVDLSLFGMDRHEWGTIHLVIGITLLALLALHIMLHWKTILSLLRRLIPNCTLRFIVALLFSAVCVVLVGFALVVEPQVKERELKGRHRIEHGYVEETEKTNELAEKGLQDTSLTTHRHAESSIEVRGYMTLIEVAEKQHVPVDYLKRHLNIPQSASDQEKLGWLRRRYGFRMSEVTRVIDEYCKRGGV